MQENLQTIIKWFASKAKPFASGQKSFVSDSSAKIADCKLSVNEEEKRLRPKKGTSEHFPMDKSFFNTSGLKVNISTLKKSKDRDEEGKNNDDI